MAPEQFRAIRLALDVTQAEFGAALGYQGANLRQQIYDMEAARKPITPMAARLAEMFRRFGIPEDFRAGAEAKCPTGDR